MHYLCVNEPAIVTKLISVLHKGSGEVLKRKPRLLQYLLFIMQHTITCRRCFPGSMCPPFRTVPAFVLRVFYVRYMNSTALVSEYCL